MEYNAIKNLHCTSTRLSNTPFYDFTKKYYQEIKANVKIEEQIYFDERNNKPLTLSYHTPAMASTAY